MTINRLGAFYFSPPNVSLQHYTIHSFINNVMVIKGIACIILCPVFCGKIWLIITPMNFFRNLTSVYFEIKKLFPIFAVTIP